MKTRTSSHRFMAIVAVLIVAAVLQPCLYAGTNEQSVPADNPCGCPNGNTPKCGMAGGKGPSANHSYSAYDSPSPNPLPAIPTLPVGHREYGAVLEATDTPPTNSPVRTSAYGSPQAFWQGEGAVAPIGYAEVSGEADNGRRSVRLVRQDYHALGNGGVALDLCRTYNNMTWMYEANSDGRTMLGPNWHLSYDIHVKPVQDGSTSFVRRADGGVILLYYVAPGVWESNAAAGEYLRLQRQASQFKLSTPDPNVWYTFELSYGKLTSVRYRNGNLVTLTYDSSGALTRADFGHETSDTDDRYLEFQYIQHTYGYDGNYKTRRRLSRVVARPSGRTVAEYSYEAVSGCLRDVKNRYGDVVERYIVNPANCLIAQIWARTADGGLQCTRRYEYNWYRQVTAVKDGAGSPIFVNTAPDDNWYMQTTEMADGVKHAHLLDYSRNPTETKVYAADGRLLRTQYQEFLTDPSWNNSSQLLKRSYDDSGATVTYDYIDESPTAPGPDRLFVKKVTHADGTSTEYEYDDNYNVTKVKGPLGLETGTGYDSAGNITWYKDKTGQTIYYRYDSKGNLTECELPTSATVRYAYDTHGRVTETTGTEGRSTRQFYDTYGRLASVTTELGQTMSVEFDGRDRPTTVTAVDGTKSVTHYDGILNRVKSATDAQGRTATNDYDSSGLLTRITDHDGRSISFQYDTAGRPTGVTDQRNKTTSASYDEFGRIQTVTNPLGQTVCYAYYDNSGAGCGCGSGAAGKVAAVTKADGTVTSFIYESGRMKRKVFNGTPDYVEYTYDVAGRTTAVKDTRIPLAEFGGQTFHYGYDSKGRLTTITYPDAAVIAYTYDDLGRCTSMTDPDGNVTQYVYANTAGNKKLERIDHPFGGRTDFVYTADGLLDYEYRYVNGTVENYSYDSLKRVSGLTSWCEQTNALINQETYTYNSDWMRTRIDYATDTGPVAAYRKQYAYDTSGRLTEEHKVRAGDNASLYQRTYTHDDAGNRTSMRVYSGSTTYTVNNEYNDWNQLEFDYGLEYYYDDNGNLELRTDGGVGFAYTHDREGRLKTYADSFDAGGVDYYYDSGGRLLQRSWVSDGGGTPTGCKTRYYYDGPNVVMEREKPYGCSTWRTKKVYTLKPSATHQIIAEREYTYSGCSTSAASYNDRWYHYDLAGSVTALTDANGSVVAQYDQEAFGNVLSGSHEGRHLTGKIYDPVSGLYYFGARWYMPSTGQWIEPEPTGADGPNLYWYGLNEAVNGADGTGQYWDPIITGWPAMSPAFYPFGLGSFPNISWPLPTNPLGGTLGQPIHRFLPIGHPWHYPTAYHHPSYPGGMMPSRVAISRIGALVAAGAVIGYLGFYLPSQTAQANSQAEASNQSTADGDWNDCNSKCHCSSGGLAYKACMAQCMRGAGW